MRTAHPLGVRWVTTPGQARSTIAQWSDQTESSKKSICEGTVPRGRLAIHRVVLRSHFFHIHVSLLGSHSLSLSHSPTRYPSHTLSYDTPVTSRRIGKCVLALSDDKGGCRPICRLSAFPSGHSHP